MTQARVERTVGARLNRLTTCSNGPGCSDDRSAGGAVPGYFLLLDGLTQRWGNPLVSHGHRQGVLRFSSRPRRLRAASTRFTQAMPEPGLRQPFAQSPQTPGPPPAGPGPDLGRGPDGPGATPRGGAFFCPHRAVRRSRRPVYHCKYYVHDTTTNHLLFPTIDPLALYMGNIPI